MCTVADLRIMPIEEVVLNDRENLTLVSKLLDREEYWIKELCSIYPYGLNDNIRMLGNVYKHSGVVVYSLFYRKYRKRGAKRTKSKAYGIQVKECMKGLLLSYNSHQFSAIIYTYVYFELAT